MNIAYRVDRSDNRARPGDPTSPAPRLTPWVNKKDGFVVFGQPDRAHMFFPANDYPTDKARFTFRVTAPKDLQAVGIGTPRSRTTAGDDATTVFSTADEISTQVVQVGVGHYKKIRGRGPHGLPLRSYVDTDAFEAAKPLVDRIPDQLSWLGAGFGLTWPASFPVARIDHILVRGVEPCSSWTLPATDSDHLPVAARLKL